MCGRAAQTISVVEEAAKVFRIVNGFNGNNQQVNASCNDSTSVNNSVAASSVTPQQHAASVNMTTAFAKIDKDNVMDEEDEMNADKVDGDDHHQHLTHIELMKTVNHNTDDNIKDSSDAFERRDNYNMSPGMDAVVFWMNRSDTRGPTGATTTNTSSTGSSNHRLEMKHMTWGLLSRNGTTTAPLEKGIAKHFQNLMYNARSDTLYEKTTFANLCHENQSCIIALDGYFEWKTELGQKQPYFVHRNTTSSHSTSSKHSYLLVAGLWKRINTGWSEDGPTMLDTFTMLTTEVCEPIKWLHTRMPVLIWDNELAVQWLQNPSCEQIHTQLVRQSQQTTSNQIQWHPVTTAMSSMKFRTIDSIRPMKNTQKSVKSFFTTTKISTASPAKESNDDEIARSDTSLVKSMIHVSVKPIVPINKVTGTDELQSSESIVEGTTTTATPSITKKRNVERTLQRTIITSPPTKKKKVPSSSPLLVGPNRNNSDSNCRTIDSFFRPKQSNLTSKK